MSNKSFKILSVFLLTLAFQAYGNPHFIILSSNESEIVIRYVPEFTDFDVKNKGVYSVKEGFVPDKASFPPFEAEMVTLGVPSFSSKIEIISVNFTTIKGELTVPEIYSRENISINNWINKYSEGVSRNLRLQSFLLYPVLYFAETGEIKKLKQLTFKIVFARPEKKSVKIDDELLENAIINYAVARNWGIPDEKSKGVYDSHLSAGIWHRANITDEGIYKIGYDKLVSLGFNPETDDPRTVKIFNNGGKSQPEKDSEFRYDDLVENPILFFGEEDGKLNTGDFLLFYGHGSDFFYYDSVYKRIENYHNQFSHENYYWITWGGENGKRAEIVPSLTVTDFSEKYETDKFIKHEVDEFNPNESGRLFLGEKFNSSQRTLTFTNNLENYVEGSEIKYGYGVAVLSENGVTMDIYENGEKILSRYLSGYGNASYTTGKYYHSTFSVSPNITDGKSVLKFSFSANTSTQNGALDYFSIRYKGYLKPANDFLIFYSPDANENVKYYLSGFSSNEIYVLRVDDFENITRFQTSNENGYTVFIANERYGKVAKYVAFTTSAGKTVNFEKVENQNVHGNEANAEFIIIAPKRFSTSAERLAEYKRGESPDNIPTAVFYTEEIYNEFSCGAQNDPTAIRDFIMYAYKHWTVKPKYVLLFGKGTYDYFDTEAAHNNFVTTYQNDYAPLNEIDSYVTDDYFCRVSGGDDYMDLAVGRLPITSAEEAETVVDKIIEYENNSDFSNWRYLASFVADDGKTSHGDDRNLHTSGCEALSEEFPEYFTRNKIYLVLYPTETTSAGRRKPEVNKAIIDAINNGTLLMHYHGHGNPDVWAHEQVFVKDVTIPKLVNKNLVFITVAACDFARSDSPSKISASEKLVLKSNSAAIGVLASQRPVYPGSNLTFSAKFYEGLFLREAEGNRQRVGAAGFYAKVNYNVVNSQKYVLLCDPTIRLKIPVFNADIDSVNGNALNNPVQIKALGNVDIKGKVAETSSFDGESIITVYDADRYVTITEPGWRNMQVRFDGAVLFKGRASVEQSDFGVGFVMPKDISFENKNGKIVAYVYNDDTDGIGVTRNVIVGGMENRENDGAGPDIEISFDDYNSHGNLVNRNFTLLARLTDETGINTSTAGLGHTLEGIIDDNLENPVDFTNSFIGDVDAGGTSGEVKYNFYDFEPGEHTLKIKAWDVFNNLSEKETEFTVVEGDGLVVKNIVNYPNPFSENTFFTFQYNLSEPIDVQINIYTVYGRKIREIKEYGIIDRFVKIFWDGRDEDGGQLANGTYLYKLIITSQSGEYAESFVGKLAIVK